MRVTMQMIADRVGVSKQAVSTVLTGRGGTRVSAKKHQKIKKVAEEIGYRFNISAQRLKSKRTNVITVVVHPFLPDDLKATPEFISPVYASMTVYKLSHMIRSAGYDIKLEYTDSETDLTRMARRVVTPDLTDGILFIGYDGTDFHEELNRTNIPHMFVGDVIDPLRHDVPLVATRRETGFAAAVEYLLESKHKRIAWVQSLGGSDRTNKLQKTIFRKYGIDDPELHFRMSDYYEIRKLVEEYPKHDFDALMCGNIVIANWCFRELRFNGYKIPEDIAVVGIDKDDSFQANNIASIGANRNEMYKTALDALLDMIKNKTGADTAKHFVFDSEFNRGATT